MDPYRERQARNTRHKFRAVYGDRFVYALPFELVKFDYPDGMVLEQCTGFRDREGRAIYEGDVVMYNGYRYQVGWHNDGFALMRNGQALFTSIAFGAREMTVEGNVHGIPLPLEHPDEDRCEVARGANKLLDRHPEWASLKGQPDPVGMGDVI